MKQHAHIVGKVEYRQGDGANAVIREGLVEVHRTLNDATLSWTDGDTHGSAAMPLTDFRRYVDRGMIRLGD
jgi:hypothetical protein